MSSALKPVLTPPTAQNPAASPSKPSVSVHPHPQSSPAPFSQSQPQSYGNPNNHEWLNVPNASQHFGGGQAGAAAFGGQKPATGYGSGYQPNLGHPPNVSQNSLPPVSQSLPATQAQPAPPTPKTPESDKPQSNGTADVKQTQDVQANHVPVEKQPPPVPDIQKTDKTDANSAPAPEPKEQPAEPAKPVDKITVTGPQPAEVPPVDQVVLSAGVPVPAITVSPAKVPPPVQVVAPVVQAVEKSQTEKSKESNSSCGSGSSPEVSPTVSTKTAEVAGNLSSVVVNKNSEEVKDVKEKPEIVPVEAAKTAVAPVPVPVPVPVPSASESVAASKETEQSPQASKPQSQTSKLALIRTPSARKSKAVESESPPSKSSTKQEMPTKVAPVVKTPSGKSKRIRTRTQPYQSPLPEIEIITKITSSTSRKSRSSDDKLIVFYKNEFLAVRNSEGSFYICQAVQNIYKSSLKLKIRWLSQDKDEKSGEIYTPDFYDVTDFDCILTNLNLERVDKGKFRLPPAEKERTDSILNRSLAAEKGEVEPPSLTEEHPDGLDLSLYKDEGQLKKRKGTKRKKNLSPGRKPAKKRPVAPAVPEPARVSKPPASSSSSRKKIPARKPFALTVRKSIEKKAPVPAAISSRSDRAKRRSAETQVKSKGSPVVDQKKAKVIAKMVKKGGSSAAAAAAAAAPAGKSQANTRSVKSSKTVVPPPKAPSKVAVSVKPSGRVSKRSSRK